MTSFGSVEPKVNNSLNLDETIEKRPGEIEQCRLSPTAVGYYFGDRLRDFGTETLSLCQRKKHLIADRGTCNVEHDIEARCRSLNPHDEGLMSGIKCDRDRKVVRTRRVGCELPAQEPIPCTQLPFLKPEILNLGP